MKIELRKFNHLSEDDGNRFVIIVQYKTPWKKQEIAFGGWEFDSVKLEAINFFKESIHADNFKLGKNSFSKKECEEDRKNILEKLMKLTN